MKRLDRRSQTQVTKLELVAWVFFVIAVGASTFGASQTLSVVRSGLVAVLLSGSVAVVMLVLVLRRTRKTAATDLSQQQAETTERLREVRKSNSEVVEILEKRNQRLSDQILMAQDTVTDVRRQVYDMRDNNATLRRENADLRRELTFGVPAGIDNGATRAMASSSNNVVPFGRRTEPSLGDSGYIPVIIDLGDVSSTIITNSVARRAKVN